MREVSKQWLTNWYVDWKGLLFFWFTRGEKNQNAQTPCSNSTHIKINTKCKGVKLKEKNKEEKVRKWWSASVFTSV